MSWAIFTCSSSYWSIRCWGGGGALNRWVHNLLMQFFVCFKDIVTTRYDHPWYVEHFLGGLYVFFTLLRY